MQTDFYRFVHEPVGAGTLPTTAGVTYPFNIADTSSAGTPSYAIQAGLDKAEILLATSATNEVQNICLYQNDVLQFDIDTIQRVLFKMRLNQSTFGAAMSAAWGLAGARNDAIDSIAQHLSFRMIGSTALLVESDDGTTDKDDVATGKSLVDTAWTTFEINFCGLLGKADVKFLIGGIPVATSTKFDMSDYSGALQLYTQIQKSAAATAEGICIGQIVVEGRHTS